MCKSLLVTWDFVRASQMNPSRRQCHVWWQCSGAANSCKGPHWNWNAPGNPSHLAGDL